LLLHTARLDHPITQVVSDTSPGILRGSERFCPGMASGVRAERNRW
jgi:hypothetical protein